jgi:hypothetical protein
MRIKLSKLFILAAYLNCLQVTFKEENIKFQGVDKLRIKS